MIFDCTIVFNELDLLELRMLELDEVVDRFVVVEAPITFSGALKSLAFADNRARFERWAARIIHVVVNDMPSGKDPWARERHQRNAIVRGLAGASRGDAIIVSDVDEIPSADAVRRWRQFGDARRFIQLFCYYWMNSVGGNWAGSRIIPFEDIGRYADMHSIRLTDFPPIENGGWHFSYLGGTDAIQAKLAAYSHQDLNVPKYRAEDYISLVTSLGIDLFERSDMSFDFWDIDDRFPAVVRQHPDRYQQYLCDGRFTEKWSGPRQLLNVASLLASLKALSGAAIEIGCWEGRSTVALAHACYPETLLAIDTWRGNSDENPNHITVVHASTRNIYQQFQRNVAALTRGNVKPIQEDCHVFLQNWRGPLKFAYVDASHDYDSVKRTLEALLPWLVPGGIVSGDDILTATRDRADLSGGVERAVQELLPAYRTADNLWWWQKV